MDVIFVGVDLGNAHHAVCVVDGEGNKVDEWTVEHATEAYAALVERLLREMDPSSVKVATEKPHGPLVELLIERGIKVFSINPKQVDRYRDRFSMAGAKDDRRDAFVLASCLRTDFVRFREVKLDGPRALALREWSRTREEALGQMLADASRLREQLHRFYPCLLSLMKPDEPWLWDLLKRFPTPEKGNRARLSGVIAAMQPYRVRRFSAEDVLAALHSRPLHVGPGVTEAASEHVQLLVARLKVQHEQVRICDARLKNILDEMEAEDPPGPPPPPPAKSGEGGNREEEAEPEEPPPNDVKIIRSIPGAGIHVTASVLAEAAQEIAERDLRTLRALGGAAPVTKQSGKHFVVTMRRACNPRLRDALFNLARVNIQHDERSRLQYSKARERGHSHGHAIRVIADKLLRTLIAMLKTRTTWNVAQRTVGAPA